MNQLLEILDRADEQVSTPNSKSRNIYKKNKGSDNTVSQIRSETRLNKDGASTKTSTIQQDKQPQSPKYEGIRATLDSNHPIYRYN